MYSAVQEACVSPKWCETGEKKARIRGTDDGAINFWDRFCFPEKQSFLITLKNRFQSLYSATLKPNLQLNLHHSKHEH
jgi:hypothetical protein